MSFFADPASWVLLAFVIFVILALVAKAPSMIAKLLDSEIDRIKNELDDARKLKEGVEPPKRKFIDLFLDSNDLNEKAIICFISFFLMMCFCITDLVTALVWDIDLKVSETIS